MKYELCRKKRSKNKKKTQSNKTIKLQQYIVAKIYINTVGISMCWQACASPCCPLIDLFQRFCSHFIFVFISIFICWLIDVLFLHFSLVSLRYVSGSDSVLLLFLYFIQLCQKQHDTRTYVIGYTKLIYYIQSYFHKCRFMYICTCWCCCCCTLDCVFAFGWLCWLKCCFQPSVFDIFH